MSVTFIGTVGPAYVQNFPRNFGVAAMKVTPTIDEAWAAVRSEQTFGWPPPASDFEVLAGALAPMDGELAATAVLLAAEVPGPEPTFVDDPQADTTTMRAAVVRAT